MKLNFDQFPKIFKEEAILLSGEPAWEREFALAVVNFLEERGYAVLGVELWEAHGNVPRVLGWSEYDREIRYNGDWLSYVHELAQRARGTIEKGQGPLFNLTWSDQTGFLKVPR